MRQRNPIRRTLLVEVAVKIVDLLGLFTAMFLSELLVHNILFGGAMYIAGEVWVLYVRIYNQKNLRRLPMFVRVRGLLIFVLAAVLTVALVLVFPYLQSSLTSLVLVVLIFGFLAQQLITDTAARRIPTDRPVRRALILAGCHAVFLAGYVLVFILNQRMLGYPVPPEIGTAYAAAFAISALQYVCQLFQAPAEPEEPPRADGEQSEDARLGVRAYRLYNRMAVNTLVAINLSITAFICYMRFMPYTGFMGSVLMLCVWLAFLTLVTVLGFALLVRRFLPRYDRYAIFFMGLVLWAAAMFRMLSANWQGSALGSLINAALMGMSLACMLSILLAQSYQMQAVIELGLGEVDRGAYARNTRVMIEWSMLTSYLLLLFMLAIATFIADGKFDQLRTIQGLEYALRVLMLVLPMGFALIALVYTLLQPLDKQYAEKLHKYSQQKASGEENPPLENRLRKVLAGNTPRRLAIILLRPLLRPFFPCRTAGRENVRAGEGPMVFLANHLEIYGPVVAVLHAPFPFRPWVIEGMLNPEHIVEQMRQGAEKLFPFLPETWRLGLLRCVAPVLLWVLRSTDPIPVHRDSLRDTIRTIEASVDAMAYDDNILIFPESEYKAEGVGALFAGFVQLGRSYYRRTGRRATFYPVYINKKARRMTFGEGIAFDPERATGAERDRLVMYLQDAMQAMADASEGDGKARRGKSEGGTAAQ